MVNHRACLPSEYLCKLISYLLCLPSGLKQQMLQLALCYNPLWLRVGLETTYGELLHLNSNSDMTGITHFIITRCV